jgi:ribosomal protein S18 acetylase RimI-like enzyme
LQIRSATTNDVDFLETMLFEAFFWDPNVARPAFDDFRKRPEFTVLLAGWGRHGDRGLIAEDRGRLIGAGWFRLWTPECHSYGFVDAATPELALAVSRSDRGRGVGRALLRELMASAREAKCPALSLSVSPFNPALSLYESVGFTKVGESGTSWTLRLLLD